MSWAKNDKDASERICYMPNEGVCESFADNESSSFFIYA